MTWPHQSPTRPQTFERRALAGLIHVPLAPQAWPFKETDESRSATLRLRQRVTNGPGSHAAGMAMALD